MQLHLGVINQRHSAYYGTTNAVYLNGADALIYGLTVGRGAGAVLIIQH